MELSRIEEFPLAALAGTTYHCGFPTTRFPLHEREDEQLCAQKCSAEEFESCGMPSYFIVYQTQVQGDPSEANLGFRKILELYVLLITQETYAWEDTFIETI